MPRRDMDLIRVARRVSDKVKKPKKPSKTPAPRRAPEPEVPEVSFDVENPGVEYSFKVDLSFTVDFEGDVSEIPEAKLRRKLKAEILAAMKGAALMSAADFGLRANNIRINPIIVSSAINDQMSVDERGVGNV